MDGATLRQRLAQRPNSVRFDELRRLLEAYGWTLRTVRGSHHTFVRGSERLTVPHRRPHVLPVYVRQALRLTEQQGRDDEEN